MKKKSLNKQIRRYIGKGKRYFSQNKFDKAIQCFDKAIEINPNIAEIYVYRGDINYIINEEQAIKDYTEAIKLNPKSLKAYYSSVLEEYFTPDTKFDFKEWAKVSFGTFHDKPVKVKLKFKKEIADDVMKYNFHPTQQIKQQKNGAVIVTFTSSGTKSILWNIFKWGTNVEIIEPESIKQEYIKMLQTIIYSIQ